jgi:hypothetical protein
VLLPLLLAVLLPLLLAVLLPLLAALLPLGSLPLLLLAPPPLPLAVLPLPLPVPPLPPELTGWLSLSPQAESAHAAPATQRIEIQAAYRIKKPFPAVTAGAS